MDDDIRNRTRRSADADGSAPPDRPSMSLRGPDDHPDDVVLAGYLDAPDDFTASERAAIAAHLEGCAACRTTVAELQTLVAALAALPEVEPARSFALTPAMVGQMEHARTPTLPRSEPRGAKQPVVVQQSSVWYARQMRAVRWATAVAAVLFVLVLTVDFTSNQSGLTPGRDDVAVTQMRQEEAMAPAAASEPTPAAASQPESDALRVAEATPDATDGGGEPGNTGAPADTLMSEQTQTPEPEQAPAGAPAVPTPDEPQPPVVADQGDEPTSDSAAGTIDAEDVDTFAAYQEQQGAEAEAQVEAGQNSRAMSTSRHYWRLAQVGLALLIVWLLAAMIVLPRMRAPRE